MHLFLADVNAAAVSELGGDPERAVGAAGVLVHLCDLAGKPGVPERPCGRRAKPPVVIARGSDTQHQAGPLNVESLPGQRGDHRVEAFGGRFYSRNTALTFLETASSVSSWRIRLFAAASSICPSVLNPGASPRSMRSCFSHA